MKGTNSFKIQSYVDSTSWCISNNDSGGVVDDSGGVLGGGEEDSSYDSDGPDAGDSTGHPSASRTTSDTLAAEYAEYVQQYHHQQHQQIPGGTSTSPTSPGYAARVEFALKLGYTERLVQAALQKLGPSPGNNELLAELIKLGARAGPLDPATPPASPPAGAAPGDDATVPDSGALYDESGVNVPTAGKLRSIVIDGSNVAMSHGNKEVFSCRGIKICVDWFRSRGHREITVFVPKWRKESPRPDNPITGQDILNELEKERLLVYTPSRLIGGKRMVCYDDRYILRLAAETDGIVVSNDNYRDLAQETPEYRRVVEERILMYSFVNDRFMPPDDPLGRAGPTLDNFLRAQPRPPPLCPYGKKCTYGNKCKFHHPERGPLPHKTVTERLSEHAQRHYLQASTRLQGKSLSLPLPQSDDARKTPLSRTRSNVPTVSETAPVNESVNLHRKLQRQLSLNPGGDSRLYGLKCYPGPPPAYNNAMLGSVQHRPLGRHSSAGSRVTTPSATASAWDLHQHVTRIASAPGPPPTIVQRPMHRMSSASDPQINLCAPNPSWPKCYMQPHVLAQHYASSTEDARRRLHYHLAAIFPEEQVTQVMNLYPDETNAQKICAAILSMFPKA